MVGSAVVGEHDGASQQPSQEKSAGGDRDRRRDMSLSGLLQVFL